MIDVLELSNDNLKVLKMEAYVRVSKQGNSMVIALTKEFREMGIEVGDWVKVEIYRPDPRDFTAMPLSYDPTKIGDLIIRSIGEREYTEEELKELIATYGVDTKRINLILQYIIEYRRGRSCS